MRILVAEDETHLNQLIGGKLQAEHYSVDSCFNGQEALDYLAGAEYDAVILDLMMPVLDGLAALQQMRRAGNTTPVLLLTARSGVDDRVEGLDAGADDYLTKPFSFDELLARIRASSSSKEKMCIRDRSAAGCPETPGVCGGRGDPFYAE